MFAQNDGKIRKPRAGATPDETHKFNEDVYKTTNNILQGLNKNISYGDGTSTNVSSTQNLDGFHSGVINAPGVANTQFAVVHNLGRVPIGFHTVSRDNGGTCYSSNIAGWTTTTILLKDTNAATQLRLFIF
jgi:hypothetical protein